MACVGSGIAADVAGPVAVFVGSLCGGVLNVIALLLQSNLRTRARKWEAALFFLPLLVAVAGVAIYLNA